MDFKFTEDQQLLADSVGKLIDKDYAFEARQAAIESAHGYAQPVWKQIGEMGVLGLPLTEASGGFGMGVVAMIPVMEHLGRGLLVEPVLSTLLAARLLERAGAKGDLLEQVAVGARKLAFAHTEPGMRYQWRDVGMQVSGSGDASTITGRKVMVVHAPMADMLVVSARTSGGAGDENGIGLFLVDPKASGLTMHTMRTTENYRAADVDFESVPATPVGDPAKAGAVIDEALDFATVLTCAEAIGAMNYANEATLEYLKSRKQFGVPIGSFQVLQHRMVDMMVSAEQSRSMTYLACDAIDQAAAGAMPTEERQRIVSAAKIKLADACRHVGQEAIQLHGGMGMTNEMKVSHTFKRLTMIGQLFGDADFHLERFARVDR